MHTQTIASGNTHIFLKRGQRNFWLEGEIPLVTTDGSQNLSGPLASIMVLEATHKLINGKPWTEGKYRIIEALDPEDGIIHFNGFSKVK